MKRITFDVPRFHIYEHRKFRGLPMVDKEDKRTTQFEDELFDRLYNRQTEEIPEEERDPELADWASEVHKMCDNLAAWRRLSEETKGKVNLSAVAVDSIMQELGPMLKEQEEKEKQDEEEATKNGLTPEQRMKARLKMREGLRAGLKKVLGAMASKAEAAVQHVMKAVEGLEQVYGYEPGKEAGKHAPQQDIKTIKKLAQELKRNPKLQHIAKLVGRFRRMAVAKHKQKVRHGVDEISDVVPGDDLARILPTELANLSHPLLRRKFFRDYLEKSLLQYQMHATEAKVRGPVVVCIDKSGSMNGDRDAWATAVALALAEIAHREKRTFALLSFDAHIMDEVTVRPGERIPEKVLFVDANGGTDIDNVYDRALTIIENSKHDLRKADIVLITDGGSYAQRARALRERAKFAGVVSFGIAIGADSQELMPWCDQVANVDDMNDIDDQLATNLFGGL